MTSRCPKRRRKAEWMRRDGGPAGRHERERRSLRNEANEGEWIASATPPWSKSLEKITSSPTGCSPSTGMWFIVPTL